MDKKELELQVASVVENLFNEKEEAELRRKTEAELQKAATSISELTTALETKNSEVAAYEEKCSGYEAQITNLTSELEATKKELETANSNLKEVSSTLEDMKKDIATEQRMTELETAGVLRSDKEAQKLKVRDMSNEDFASYKEELVSIRQAVIDELEKAKAKAAADSENSAATNKDTKGKDAKNMEENVCPDCGNSMDKCTCKTDKKKNKQNSSTDSKSEEDAAKIDTPPAQITPGQTAMAALNMEYLPNEGLVEKYRKMGEAMAKKWKENK